MITGLDHVQLAMPRGAEGAARAFYTGLLGMTELPKPPVLAARGGCWFASGSAVVHVGVEEPFSPARKAHPAFLVDDLDMLQAGLTAAGHDCIRTDGEVPGVRRFHTHDCFGNRVEFQQALPAQPVRPGRRPPLPESPFRRAASAHRLGPRFDTVERITHGYLLNAVRDIM